MNLSIPGWNFIYLDTIGSTNDIAKDFLMDGGNYFIVLAREQTRGRGRKGNVWYSPEGGVWMSVGMNCQINAKDILTPLVHNLCKRLSDVFGIPFEVKLPNDIFLNKRKVAGILMETSISEKQIISVIVGIGINVNNKIPDELQHYATSLKSEGISTTVSEVAELIANEITTYLDVLSKDQI